MDKASDFGSEDCRFESCHSRFWIYNKVYFEIEIFQADHICIVLLKRLFTVTLGLSVLNLQESLFWNLPYLHCASKTFFHCISRESNPGQLLGRQLCSPLYHYRLTWLFIVPLKVLEFPLWCCEPTKKRVCDGRESNPGQLLGRQLCSPLYHWCLINTLNRNMILFKTWKYQ